MRTAFILVLIVISSVLFHLLSPWWSTPIASNWVYIDNTISLTFWITGIVFAAVVLFLAYCVYRFRHREGSRAVYEPENKKLELWLTVGTAAGVAALLAPGLYVWGQFVRAPDGASEIEVVGQQWQWTFRLPGKDGKLGISDPQYITADNPLGVSPNDPNGRDDVIITDPEIHLPLGKPVRVVLRSIDVVHDFYVPEIRAKMDLVPGMETHFWFTPTKTGTFEILCAGYCGVGHPMMRGTLVVDTDTKYQAWLQQQKTFADLAAPVKKAEIGNKAPL
ncbi:MAG: cytochrome c oxidase subunit II [Rhodomicrobium sp.]